MNRMQAMLSAVALMAGGTIAANADKRGNIGTCATFLRDDLARRA